MVIAAPRDLDYVGTLGRLQLLPAARSSLAHGRHTPVKAVVPALQLEAATSMGIDHVDLEVCRPVGDDRGRLITSACSSALYSIRWPLSRHTASKSGRGWPHKIDKMQIIWQLDSGQQMN
jgi:hypothetical protein